MEQQILRRKEYPLAYNDGIECSCEEDLPIEEQLTRDALEELKALRKGEIEAPVLLLYELDPNPNSCEECDYAKLGIGGDVCHGCVNEWKLQFHDPMYE